MSNKKLGNDFESEFGNILSEHGYWVHLLSQNSAGQPADVIAVKNAVAYLIDCKVCSTEKGFALNRMEENQNLLMELWNECGNGQGWFAMKLPTDDIFMLPHFCVKSSRNMQSHLSPAEIFELGKPLEKWVSKCR
jgi:Holliday junction resolvase